MTIESNARQGTSEMEVVVPVSFRNIERFAETQVAHEIERLVEFLWPINVRVRFVAGDVRVNMAEVQGPDSDRNAVCLFSGGVDSLAAIFHGLPTLRPIALFVAHRDQAGSINIVTRLSNAVLRPYGIPLMRVYGPPLRRVGYSQMRGFLYGMAALSLADCLGAGNIILGECGPTMYQPTFGPFDQRTMTTNPAVIEAIASIARKVTDNRIRILTPLAGMTKAEAIGSLKPSWLKLTHSCISQQFRKHDGTCYGCVIRRLGSRVVGVPDVEYRYDPFVAGPKGRDNMLSLLRFSHDMVMDFEALPYETLEEIRAWGTRDLFERFALDNLAGLTLWSDGAKRLPVFAERVTKSLNIPELAPRLEQRIKEVRRANRDCSERRGDT